jgi:hypothetical protein
MLSKGPVCKHDKPACLECACVLPESMDIVWCQLLCWSQLPTQLLGRRRPESHTACCLSLRCSTALSLTHHSKHRLAARVPNYGPCCWC